MIWRHSFLRNTHGEAQPFLFSVQECRPAKSGVSMSPCNTCVRNPLWLMTPRNRCLVHLEKRAAAANEFLDG